MPYVTSIERLAKEEGREEGREEGMGALRELITETLQVRFGDAPRAVRDHLDATKALPELKALHRIALTCKNLAEFKRASRK